MTINDMLGDKDQPLCSHFGCIALLSFMDSDFVICNLFPKLRKYTIEFLQPKLVGGGFGSEACHVMARLLVCIRHLFRSYDAVYSLSPSNFESLMRFDFVSLFGDSLVPILPPPSKSLDRVSDVRRRNLKGFAARLLSRPISNRKAAARKSPKLNYHVMFESEKDLSNKPDIVINCGQIQQPRKNVKQILNTNTFLERPKISKQDKKTAQCKFEITASLLSWI